MRKLGSENGAITMVTLITIIFMVSFLISSYVMVANKVKTQKEMLAQTKAIYEPKLTMEEVYNSYFTNGDIIPIYTVEELLKIGSDENITKNGKTYTYSYSSNYLLMNDLEFSAGDLNLENDWLVPYENEDFKGNFDWNGHTIKVTELAGNTITYDGKYLVTINTTENSKVLTNAVKSNLVNLKIEGNSVQDREPSPETPAEIQSVGDLITDETDINYGKYKIQIIVTGKNLLNPDTVDEELNVYVRCDNGKDYTPSSTGGTWRASDFISVSEGKKYHFNAINNNASYAGVAWYDVHRNYISGVNTTTINNNNGNIVAPENARYLRVSWRIDEGYNPNWQNTVQLEEGEDGTPYEPYVGQTYNIYLDEPLREAGDSEDYIDYEQGKIKRQFVTYTFDGSDDENWKSTKQSETKTCFYISCPNNDEGWRKPNTTYSLSSHFKQNYTNATTVDNNDDEGFAVANTTNILYIGILNSNLDTLDIEGFRKWLSEQKSKGKPLTVIVKNERPDEFIDLPDIQLYKGTNIITVGTEISPSNISVTYNAKQ